MELISLKSGSRGNSALVLSEKTKILIDCGISGKTAENTLKGFDINPHDIDAVVVTHEHLDHISGIGVMMRRYNLPVYANNDTWNAMLPQIGKVDETLIREFKCYEDFEIGDIGVSPLDRKSVV